MAAANSNVIVNLWRPKCPHAAERRCFRVFSASEMTFNKLESQMRCSPEGMMEVLLAKNEDGPWTALDDEFNEDLFDMPVGTVLYQFPGTKFVQFKCIPPDETQNTASQAVATPGNVSVNAFDMIMMAGARSRSAPTKKQSSSGVSAASGGLSRKDELYNKLVDMMSERNWLFYEPKTEGNYVAQALTNALWYITNQHSVINERSQREKDVKPIPSAFQDFEGYNEHRRKKQKALPLQTEQLNQHAEVLLSLSLRPVMRSTPAWEEAHNEIKELALCLKCYHDYLLKQNKKTQTNQNLEHPARPVAEFVSVWSVLSTSTLVRPEYILLDKVLNVVDYYEPIHFDEDVHLKVRFANNMQRVRFFERLQLSVNVDIFKYSPGGSVITCHYLMKFPGDRTESEKATRVASVMLKIKPKLPEIHTRAMKREFSERFSNIAKVKPAVVELLYKELAMDVSAASNPEMQQRLRLIFMEETGLVADLRHMNTGRPGHTYDSYFTKKSELVEEYTAADERRHNVAHLSHFLSVEDLMVQTKERCPEGTEIPSKALVRLQFTPRNPYCHAVLNFSSRIPVQFKIQQRQLRITHPDDHYCSALWKYMREFAIKFADTSTLFCCDDKAKIPIGEPDVMISTGVRGKTVTPVGTTLTACDHDLHQKGNLTPSVYLRCDIPTDIKGTFYKGTVATFINDSVFQASTPMRHATAIVKLVRDLEKPPNALLKFTDGGSDHRNNLESVKVAAICLFKELDLDFYAAGRCAPGHSWTNPCERMMSILNIGLQNCSLARAKSSESTEKMLRSCNSMQSIRNIGKSKPEIKDEWASSVEPVQQIIESRFRRLSLKREPVQVRSPVGEEEIDLLSRHANYLFPDMDLTKLQKVHTRKVASYRSWVEKHCRERHYIFQIKKCEDLQCCQVAPKETYAFIPDPELPERNDEHYSTFEKLYGSETSENFRPTIQKNLQSQPPVNEDDQVASTSSSNVEERPLKQKRNVQDPSIRLLPEELKAEASVLTAQNARSVITCQECDKPRLIYSKLKLSGRQPLQLATLMSEYEYTCGSPLTPPDSKLHGKAFVRLNIQCGSQLKLLISVQKLHDLIYVITVQKVGQKYRRSLKSRTSLCSLFVAHV